MPQSDPNRTEKATPKRIKKARDEGSVAKSQELSKTLVVLVGLVMLWIYISFIGDELMKLMSWFFKTSFTFNPTKQDIYRVFVMVSVRIAVMVLPVLLVIGTVAFITTRIQVGSLWTTKVFKPKLGKMFNIVSGLKKLMFSTQSLVRLVRTMGQAAAIAIAPYLVLKSEMNNLLPLFYQDVFGLTAYMLVTAGKMVIYALVPMLIIAAADTWYSHWDYHEQMKMTKDEVKDERKQIEGDPKVKMKQKEKMFQFMAMRMMQAVPKADVVITNPTHIAVALRYDPAESPAPVVLAKGKNKLAEKIKEIAREHSIPLRENKPLAWALYESVEIGETIPEELFQAVASILAQLAKFKPRGAPA